jgi:hypothetical protein
MELLKQHDREYLKKNIYLLNLVNIVKTQKVDASFAVKYLLNKKYQLADDEKLITPKMILFYQPHIKKEELLNEMILYDSDEDSIDDFETVSNN